MITEARTRAELPIDQEGVVVVDFYTDDCRFCDMITESFDDVEFDLPFVPIVKINCAQVEGVSDEFDVRMFPTVKVFKDGAEVAHLVGFQPADALRTVIGEHLY